MEGKRERGTSIQRNSCSARRNKSIPFLELAHSNFLGQLLANVGHRRESNRFFLYYTRKETFATRFSAGNEKRHQTFSFLSIRLLYYFLIRSEIKFTSLDLFSIFFRWKPGDIFRSLPIIKFPTKLEIGMFLSTVDPLPRGKGPRFGQWGQRDENNGSSEITGDHFRWGSKNISNIVDAFFFFFLIKGGGSIDAFQLNGKWLLVDGKMQKDLPEFVNLVARLSSE